MKKMKDTVYNINIKTNNNNSQYECFLNTPEEKEICKCKINIDLKTNIWTISSWFVNKEYQNQGLGKLALSKLLNYLFIKYNTPDKIEYIWNGANAYVLEWLENHFNAICKCPIVIQKTMAEDDWLSHIYELDIEKVFEYFHIETEKDYDEKEQ